VDDGKVFLEWAFGRFLELGFGLEYVDWSGDLEN
jgi:hypothetical protein